MKPWGIHAVIDMHGCPRDKVCDPAVISDFVKAVIAKIDMVPMRPIWMEYCETHDPAKFGWSFYQMIQDSNISGHLCDVDTKDPYFGSGFCDVFSCKEYDPKVVEDIVREYFHPKELSVRVIHRF